MFNNRFKKTLPILLGLYLSAIPLKVFSINYSETYFFGDSLTDNGNNPVAHVGIPAAPITNGDANSMWPTYLSTFYSTNSSPRNYDLWDALGGGNLTFNPNNTQTNYAVAGATTAMTNLEIVIHLIDKNILSPNRWQNFLDAINGPNTEQDLQIWKDNITRDIVISNTKLDPNAYYTYWSGANDLIFSALIPGENPILISTPAQSADNIIKSISLLRLAGANNITVITQPDLTKTPRGNAAIRHAILNPPNYEDDIVNPDAYSDATKWNEVNKILLPQIKNLNYPILVIDGSRIFDEIMTDPQSFGFTDTEMSGHYNVPTGPHEDEIIDNGGVGSENHTGRVFYDGLHPTITMHKVFGEAVLSIQTAPHTIVTMSETTRNISHNINSTLLNQLQLPNSTDTKILPFFATQTGAFRTPTIERTDSTANTTSLTIGFKAFPSSTLNLGFAFTAHNNPTKTKINAPKFNATGSFNLHGYTASFLMNTSYEVLNTNFIFQIGSLYYDDIERSFKLGPKTTKAIGSTHGYYTSSLLKVDINFLNKYSKFVNVGPFVEFNYNRLSIDEFKETNARSTNVAFHGQHFEDLIGGLGLQCLLNLANTTKGDFNINGRLSWHQRLVDISTPIEFHHAPDKIENGTFVSDDHLKKTRGQFPVKPANNIAFFKGSIDFTYTTIKNKLTTSVGYFVINGEGNMFSHSIATSIRIPLV